MMLAEIGAALFEAVTPDPFFADDTTVRLAVVVDETPGANVAVP
jgi:hypothetical protein